MERSTISMEIVVSVSFGSSGTNTKVTSNDQEGSFARRWDCGEVLGVVEWGGCTRC